MIDGMRSYIRENENGDAISGNSNTIISPVLTSLFHLKMQTLQNAPRDPSKLKQLIKAKEREREKQKNDNKARCIEDNQRDLAETDMLKFVLFLVSGNGS
jgi:hypothetical protein